MEEQPYVWAEAWMCSNQIIQCSLFRERCFAFDPQWPFWYVKGLWGTNAPCSKPTIPAVYSANQEEWNWAILQKHVEQTKPVNGNHLIRAATACWYSEGSLIVPISWASSISDPGCKGDPMSATVCQVMGFLVSALGFAGCIAATVMDAWSTQDLYDNPVTAVFQYQGLWRSCVSQSSGLTECRPYFTILGLPGRDSGLVKATPDMRWRQKKFL